MRTTTRTVGVAYICMNLIVSSPQNLRWGGGGEGGGRGIVFENWTKRGVMKKLLRNSGLVEMGGGSFRKGEGFSNCFINFP